jgi:hypothetical protein
VDLQNVSLQLDNFGSIVAIQQTAPSTESSNVSPVSGPPASTGSRLKLRAQTLLGGRSPRLQRRDLTTESSTEQPSSAKTSSPPVKSKFSGSLDNLHPAAARVSSKEESMPDLECMGSGQLSTAESSDSAAVVIPRADEASSTTV